MKKDDHAGSIYLRSSIGFEKKVWLAQRTGWTVLALLIAAVLAGLFGKAESVGRALIIYLYILFLTRIAGNRTLSEVTVFDFVLLLILSEGVSQGLTGDDHTVTNAVIVASSLIFFDIMLSLLKSRFPAIDDLVEGQPIVIVENGKPLKERIKHLRVDEDDIMEAARRLRGLERMDQIKYAVLEISGGITIIPQEKDIPPT